MSRTASPTRPRGDRRARGAVLAVMVLLAGLLGFWQPAASADTAPTQVDLRVLVINNGNSPVDGLKDQLDREGIPHTDVNLWDGARPIITDAFLSSGNEAFFQAVITPDNSAGGINAPELAALRAYEAKFGIREVDAFDFASFNDGIGNVVWTGQYGGHTATVTADGKANGFGYLSGSILFNDGSFAYLETPLTATTNPPMPAGARFTTLVSGTVDSATGSLIGVYANAGVERMIITTALASFLFQGQALAHGIITWATRGVHLGYNRNSFTMHVDDAFSSDNTWDAVHNCTPGEDCPLDPTTGESLYPELPIRMTTDDVAHAAQWSAANDYELTLAFNGSYSAPDDALTQAFQAQKNAFRWLNHGSVHIYQGCQQDFTVVPWRCITNPPGGSPASDGSNLVWVSQADVSNEINSNIATGNALGLPFNPSEYLSGEHSGLTQKPQQPVDNPNFVAAVSQAHLAFIGADASREPTQRVVGGALTVPRHPTAIYYNAGTVAQEIDEYNWLYNKVANGGSGYCEANPDTATCLPAPLGADGFTSYIVPTDAAFDLHFILSNDPRPFYAHVSNLAGDRILYPLLEAILGRYRSTFAGSAPLQNLTMTQAGQALQRQAAWAGTGMAANPVVSAFVKDGKVTIQNGGNGPVPVTVPNGTTVAGVSLEAYGGELSGWLPAAATTVSLPTPTLSVTGSAQFQTGVANSLTITATASPLPSLAVTGALPAGVVFTDSGDGTGSIGGTPATGTDGSYPITVTATSGSGQLTQVVTLLVGQPLAFTSAPSATATAGSPFTFKVTTTAAPSGSLAATPAPGTTLTLAGALPAGVTFTDNGDGTASFTGTPAANTGGAYPLTITAAGPSGTATQSFTLTVNQVPAFTSAASVTAANGAALSFKVTTTGFPAATITRTGALPTGVTFTAAADGTATFAGTPTVTGTFVQTLTATNAGGTATQSFTVNVLARQAPTFTSAATATATAGQAFTFAVTTTANPAATLTMAGTLPAGVTFTAGANGTATLSGTPAATAGGTYTVTFTATNTAGSRTQSFTLTVNSAPLFTSATSANASTGTAFSFTVRASGLPRPQFTVAGALPAGINFVSNTNGTATLSGTTAVTGTFPVTFTATNSIGTATQNFTLTVRTVPTFTSPANATPIAGQPFTFTVAAAGVPTPTLTRAGQMPTGLTWVANSNGTATISGTPAVDAGGTWSATFTATSSAGTVSQDFLFTVNQPAAFSSGASTNWTLGTASTFTVRASGYPTPTVALTSALPPGVQFVGGSGRGTLSGTPTQSGAFPITFTATNSLGVVQQTFTLTVRQAPAITSPASAAGTVGTAFSFSITTSGYPAPTLSRTGTLPPGVTFSTSSGTGVAKLAGTPTTRGTYTLTVTAQNALGTVTQTLTITIS